MPELEMTILTYGLSGQLGPYVIRQFRKTGKVFISAMPTYYTKSNSMAAVTQRNRFREAVAYGKQVLADPALRVPYDRKAAKKRFAFNVAIADAMNAPRITRVDTHQYTGQPGSTIVISARDDFQVASVQVALYTPEGQLLEGAAATKGRGPYDWHYRLQGDYSATPAIRLSVTACDLPGNSTVHTQELVHPVVFIPHLPASPAITEINTAPARSASTVSSPATVRRSATRCIRRPAAASLFRHPCPTPPPRRLRRLGTWSVQPASCTDQTATHPNSGGRSP